MSVSAVCQSLPSISKNIPKSAYDWSFSRVAEPVGPLRSLQFWTTIFRNMWPCVRQYSESPISAHLSHYPVVSKCFKYVSNQRAIDASGNMATPDLGSPFIACESRSVHDDFTGRTQLRPGRPGTRDCWSHVFSAPGPGHGPQTRLHAWMAAL